MASNYIKVNTDALKHDGNELESLAKKAETQLKKISEGMETLSGMWTGPANSAFMKQFGIDYEFLLSICKQVESFSGDLKNAATEYDKCEDSVMDAVRRIKV